MHPRVCLSEMECENPPQGCKVTTQISLPAKWREGDWIRGVCSNHNYHVNYASKLVCNKCGRTPQPMQGQGPHSPVRQMVNTVSSEPKEAKVFRDKKNLMAKLKASNIELKDHKAATDQVILAALKQKSEELEESQITLASLQTILVEVKKAAQMATEDYQQLQVALDAVKSQAETDHMQLHQSWKNHIAALTQQYEQKLNEGRAELVLEKRKAEGVLQMKEMHEKELKRLKAAHKEQQETSQTQICKMKAEHANFVAKVSEKRFLKLVANMEATYANPDDSYHSKVQYALKWIKSEYDGVSAAYLKTLTDSTISGSVTSFFSQGASELLVKEPVKKKSRSM